MTRGYGAQKQNSLDSPLRRASLRANVDDAPLSNPRRRPRSERRRSTVGPGPAGHLHWTVRGFPDLDSARARSKEPPRETTSGVFFWLGAARPRRPAARETNAPW